MLVYVYPRRASGRTHPCHSHPPLASARSEGTASAFQCPASAASPCRVHAALRARKAAGAGHCRATRALDFAAAHLIGEYQAQDADTRYGQRRQGRRPRPPRHHHPKPLRLCEVSPRATPTSPKREETFFDLPHQGTPAVSPPALPRSSPGWLGRARWRRLPAKIAGRPRRPWVACRVLVWQVLTGDAMTVLTYLTPPLPHRGMCPPSKGWHRHQAARF